MAQVRGIGELPDGRPYFVMEHADADALADLLEADGPGACADPSARGR